MLSEQTILRFWAKVDKNGPVPRHCPEIGPCHVWTGALNRSGYGMLAIEKRPRLAHRLAFLIAHGRWPDPCALHKCDNRSCVRIDHLFEGTNQDNNLDAQKKGRVGFAMHQARRQVRVARVVALMQARRRERAE